MRLRVLFRHHLLLLFLLSASSRLSIGLSSTTIQVPQQGLVTKFGVLLSHYHAHAGRTPFFTICHGLALSDFLNLRR
jgi:hypothetical protein